ncbi:MAG: hypothetical protein FJX59_18925 [Alphaproteobacteria bacterium]|nr:hypothetical protein [Alphaproteobacteria bacterium]
MPDVYGDETIVVDGSGARGGGMQQLASAPVPRSVQPRATFDPGSSSVSSQIGTISFAPGSTRLSATAKSVLADVAQLRADVDGAVRVEARGADATARAAAISAELKRLGVPAARLYAGNADSFGDEADLYLDY